MSRNIWLLLVLRLGGQWKQISPTVLPPNQAKEREREGRQEWRSCWTDVSEVGCWPITYLHLRTLVPVSWRLTIDIDLFGIGRQFGIFLWSESTSLCCCYTTSQKRHTFYTMITNGNLEAIKHSSLLFPDWFLDPLGWTSSSVAVWRDGGFARQRGRSWTAASSRRRSHKEKMTSLKMQQERKASKLIPRCPLKAAEVQQCNSELSSQGSFWPIAPSAVLAAPMID